MSSTNKTTNLELSQFLGSDSPKWLTDYNADMEKIDAGYQTVKAQADATDLIVGGHTSSISTLQETTTSQGTAITQLRTDVNGNTGSINTINSLIGNGEPTTTDKTLIGAINELDSDITNYEASAFHDITISADGVKTVATLLNELYDSVIDYVEANPNKKIILLSIRSTALRLNCPVNIGSNHMSGGFAIGDAVYYDSGIKVHAGFVEPANSKLYVLAAGTESDLSSNVPAAGNLSARLIVIS